MACMRLLSLVTLLLAIVSCCFADEYQPLTALTPQTATLQPCEFGFWQVDTSASNSVNNYLSINVLSNVSSTVVVSTTEYSGWLKLSSTNATGYSKSGANVTLDVVCTYLTATTWFITIGNDAGVPISYTVVASIVPVPITPVTLNTVYNNPRATGYQTDTYVDLYDVYSLSLAQTANLGQTLIVDVTSPVPVNILYNTGALAANYGDNVCYNAITSTTTLTINYCTYKSLVAQSPNAYIAISPQALTTTPTAYSLNVTTPAPSVKSLTPSQVHLDFITPGQTKYYSFPVANNTNGVVVTAHIQNVEGGSVDFSYQFGELPFTSCLGYTCSGDTPSCCVDVDVGCQLVVNSCFIQDGTYYLGVTGSQFDSPQQPIVFEVLVNITGIPSVSSVKDGEFITATVSQSQYNHYMLEDSDSDDDGYLEFHLYVDQSNNQSSQVIMYVNYDGYAGSNGDSCYSSVAQCSVGNVGACTIQINPCLFDEHTNWYASVYAGSYSDLNQKGQQYTLSATILNPVELEEPSIVLHSVLYPGTMDHYSIDEDLLPEGGGFFLVVNAVNGGQVNVYQNAGGLAGPLDTCPTCYNYTEYRTTSQRLVWPVMNCNSTTNEDKDDYYFSVMSNNAPGGALISYSITVVEWEELDPSDDLDNGKVLVDFIGANAANNYTLESSSGSDSYLVITLTQVDVYSASQFVPLTLSLVNTTNANCADSNTYSESCTISSSTYECSIVVQQCDLTTSDGFVAFVNNYNNQLSAHYNLYYETYKSTPVDLVNGQSFAGSVMTNTYQMFSYESTGSDTLIIEVFFDKTCTTVDGGVCEGQLYVTTDKPNADKCIPITEAEYYVEDTTKCVFALTTCSLPEEMIYFAVSTKSELHASYPLSFTAKVTEMSSATAIQPLHPTQAALYPRQKNYHTFTTTANAPTSFTTLNVTVNSVQNGQVVVVLAEDTQASETCECFEFVDQLMVEYCDITSPNWAALVQSVPGSNTPANQLIEYTIVVGQFVNTPMALPISTAYPPTPAYGSLLRGQYAYYQLTLTNPPSTPLVLSVTNIANGVLTIFYSTTPNQPATRTCGGGRIVATGVSGAGGSWPLGNCETTDSLPTYITIFAASTTDFKNVTYSVSLLNTPVITVTTLQSGLQALPAGFTRDYQATLDLSTSVAPMVTFYVENVTSQRANTFKLVVSNSNTCESAAALHTVTCQPNANCSISISDCGLKASTNFYLVITSTTNTNYTVRVELVDLAASSIPLTLTQDPTTSVYTGSSSAQVSAGSFPWVTFTVTVPAAPGYSLELDVTSDGASGSLYSSFQEATPDCYIPSLSETNSFNAITQNACCSQAGTLSVAVYTAVAATINLDVTMTPVILPAVTLTATNAASDLVQNQPLAGVQPVMMPFSTQTVPYASVYMAVTLTDDTDDVYFKQGSPAGPTQGSGACLGSDFSCTRSGAVCYYNVPQCFTSGEPFQNPAAYYAGVDSSNPTTFNVTYGLAPYSAVNAGAQGNFAYVPAQPVYVTFTATNPSVEIDVSINVTYSDNAAQVYIYSGQCEQGTPLLTCSGSPCLFQTPSCSIPSDDFLVVVHTQSTTVGGTVTIDAGMVPNTIAYTAQSLDNGAVVAVSGNTNNYVTATVSKATATQYSELLISNYTGSVSGLTVYWTVQGQHLCFTEISVKVVCEVQQDLTNTCTAILSSCELIDGLYYFDIELSSSTATAQVSFVGLQTENTIPITALPAVQAGSVLANQRLTYSIELDVLVPQPGQSIELSLNNICGETSLYLYGDDNLCPVSSGKSYTIDKCSLLNSSAVNNQVNTLYFSVNGDAQSYPNSPARFVFEVALQGEPIAFVPVGTNELITYAPNTVWVFPISGISDFVGQLQFVYGQGVEGSHLVISFDVPTFCASPSETITFNSTFLYLNSCTIDKYRQVYISFADGSDGASFQITHARPFTRNLNDFTENPQTGAVAPSSNSVSQTSYFVDEEYYSLEVDSSVQNFQFAAWVSDDDDPTSPTTASTVRLQSSLVEPPSMCSTTNTQNAAWNRKVTWEWCQVGDNTPIYLTVNNPVATNGSPKAEARSYNLYFTTVLDTPPTELSANQPLCAPVMNKTTAYFHAVATSTATAHQKIRVSSVTTLEGTGALDVYISTGGLASATCNENANFGSQCNAVSNVCEFDLSCFTGGNISVAVVNGMTENASFYIEYISTPIQPLSITVNAATAVVIGANNGTAQTYYLMATVPTLAANQWLAVSATSPQSAQTAFTLWYSVGTMPGTECYEGMCTSDASGECALLVNSCTPPAVNQIIYIVVQSTGQFNVWVDVVSTTLNTLGAQQRVAGSFAVADYVNADTLHSMITKPLVYTYQITVSADDIANNLLGDMTIVVDSVNQGSIANPALLVWVTPATAGYFGDECVLDSALVGPSTPGALYVPPCQFTSGSYFVTVALNLDANLDGCTDVTFGIAYSFTKANPTVTNIDNVSVSANVPIGTSDQSFYSLSGNELTGVYVQVPNQVRFDLSYFRAPFALGASASCETYLHDSNSTDDSTITSFTQYWWGCTAHNTTSNLVLDVTGPPGLLTVLPGTQYTVTGVSQAIASLTSTPASYTFAYSFLTQQAYKFTIDVDDSAQINVQLTKGPSVHVELYSSTCDSNNENVLMTAMDCYAGLCKIPISWSAGDLDNNTVYYVVVSGYAPAAYSVSLLTGQSGTCVEPTNTTLCDVSWTVWNYGTGEAGFGLQDSAAIRMYQTLLNSFCPPCGCTEISSKCNSSLIEYVCTQSYRACDTTGLQTSVCEDTCADVENNCGVTFAEVGLPYLSCNHNFYYTEDDGSTVCEDIYDITQTDRKDQLLWLIALVVLVLVVLIILGVVGYLGYKKYKHGRQGNSYEKIKEPSSDDEVVDEIAVD